MMVANRDRSFPVVLLCFLLSGFAALLYQTTWTRQFSFVFGTSELAVATVLAAYMAGLAAGAAVAGRLALRIRRPLLVYALLELGIGASALLVPRAIRASMAFSVFVFGGSDAPPDAGGTALALFYLACSFLVLLVPTGLMGATLPMLARHAVHRDEEIGSRIGLLYAVNTLGAILGTLAAAFLLLPALGLLRTLLVGLAANLMVFLLAASLARPGSLAPAEAESSAKSPRSWSRPDLILPLILLSGVTSFAYEVLWTRLIGQVLGGSVYGFATMLASFLTGIAVGSAVASRLATTRAAAIAGFGVSQLGIAFCSLLAFSFLDDLPDLVRLWQTGASGVRASDVAATALMMLPSTLFIGATFPFAVRITARGDADAGPSSARVFAWNTVGAIVGAVGAGFLLVPALGFAGSLTAMVSLNLLLAASSSFLTRPPLRRLIVAAVVAALLVVWLPPRTPWNLLRFSPLRRIVAEGALEYAEVGRSATVLLLRREGHWYVSSNGLPESAIRDSNNSSGDLTNRWLGALPVLARPETQSMLVVGLGGGRVLEEIPASVERVDVIELEPAVVAANRVVSDRRFVDPLADPRVRLYANDARGALLLTGRRYDAIVSQPSHPWTAGASHLYTREFFELAKQHLERGGVFVQWIGLGFVDESLLRVLVATMNDVFPFVRVYRPPAWKAVLFMGSEAALPVEETAERAIRGSPNTFRRMGIQAAEDTVIPLALDEQAAREFGEDAAVSTDDVNILQMQSPRVLARPLTAARADAVLEPYDPLVRVSATLDRLYLANRLVARRPQRYRLVALRESSDSPLEEQLIATQLLRARGAVPVAALRLTQIVEGEAEAPRARQLLAQILAPDAERGDASALDRIRALEDPSRAVVDAWRSGDDRALRSLDERLARVGPREILYPDAIRQRARWRVASGDPTHAGEAVDLLDAIVAGTDGTTRDLLLRARAAWLAGDLPTALDNLRNGVSRLRSSESPRIDARKLADLLEEIPLEGAFASRREAIERSLRKSLATLGRAQSR